MHKARSRILEFIIMWDELVWNDKFCKHLWTKGLKFRVHDWPDLQLRGELKQAMREAGNELQVVVPGTEYDHSGQQMK